MFLSLICFSFVAFVTVAVKGEGCGNGENCECGISKNIEYYEGFNSNGQNRILGGRNSDPQDWPFVVALSVGCTGTIINNQWILSAAHCVPENENEKVTVITIDDNDYDVEKLIPHEKYSNDTGMDDIMLVKLKAPLEFSENVSSICILKNLTVLPMEVAAAAGYGQRFIRVKTLNDTFQEGELNSTEIIYEDNDLLRETPLLIRNISYCSEAYDYSDESEDATERVICAGGANRGTTQGDSGGPLLVIRDHRWVQYGVTAYGSVMPIPDDLLAVSDQGIYTKVNAYCDWIAEKTANEVTCQ